MNLKVCLKPSPSTVAPDNGIGRVLHAQYKYLKDYGVDLVDDPVKADICAGHTQKFDMPHIDILMLHGMYWTGDPNSGAYDDWHAGVNHAIVEAAREAYAVTVPSEWVAMPFKRDMRIRPIVIGHGIEVDKWRVPKEHDSYILWNKNRPSDVCDPTPAYELARLGVNVISTFKPLGVNTPATLKVTGKLAERDMHKLITSADVYLATTQETFGIGTLEAMACGVPVLGWNWGGTRDLVTHQVNGYLVEPHDINGLLAGLDYIRTHRAEMSAAARATAEQFTWPTMIEKYAQLFEEVYQIKRTEQNGVSIVITNYNYAEHVCDAIDSALNQTTPPAEVIVVDDGSTDDSLARLETYKTDKRVKVIAQKNQGVAAARTNGIRSATQEHIVCLDADDRIEPEFISTLLPPMRADRGLGIAYSGLRVVYPSGDSSIQKDWPPEFSWEGQATPHNPPSNCIPSACLFRKEMWRRAGPHKQEYAPGEDAEFWTRGLSVGFTAQRITPDPLFVYYAHQGSASRAKVYRPIDDRLPWMRDRRYPFAAPVKDYMPNVRSYSRPLISIVIPVGVGHARYLPDALDSLTGQTFREWEVIVVDDTWQATGKDTIRTEFTQELAQRYPFIRYELSKKRGASNARNIGLEAAQAPLVLWLDADDVLMPNALYELVKAYIASGGKYTYGDIQILRRDGPAEFQVAAEYQQVIWNGGGLHSVTALVPTDWLRNVGGLDESIIGWEDGDLFTRLAIAGYCGKRVPKPLLVYRAYSGGNRNRNWQNRAELTEVMNQKYGAYLRGEKHMQSCCGGNGAALLLAKQFMDGMPQDPNGLSLMSGIESTSALIRMEFLGKQIGEVSFFGLEGREYRGGNSTAFRYADVNPADVEKLERTGKWKRVVVMPISEAPIETQEMKIERTLTPEPELIKNEAINRQPIDRQVETMLKEAQKMIKDDQPKAELTKPPVKSKGGKSSKSHAVSASA